MDEHRLLTNSRLGTAKKCLRAHFFRYELGIAKSREATALRLGTVFHAALDLLATQGLEAALEYLATVYNDKTIPDWSTPYEWACEGAKMRAMVIHYYHYHTREDRPIFGGKVIASEVEFVIPIKNPETNRPSTNFVLSGKIDKLLQLEDGRYAIMEHKTTSDDVGDNSDYWPRLRIDQQVSIYFLAAQWMEWDVSTIIYDVSKKPHISPLSATPKESRKYTKEGKLYANQRENDETPEDYFKRLSEDIGSRPQWYFARKEIARLEKDMQEFQLELWQMQQLMAYCRNNQCWPRNSGACLNMGRCQYADICFQGLNPVNGMVPGYKQLDSIHPELKGDKANG